VYRVLNLRYDPDCLVPYLDLGTGPKKKDERRSHFRKVNEGLCSGKFVNNHLNVSKAAHAAGLRSYTGMTS
jgi:hypothetical protein